LPDRWLSALPLAAKSYETVRAAGGVCIADRCRTGYGRLGDWFWALKRTTSCGLVVCWASQSANGHPLGAVVTNARDRRSFANGMEFFSTFGGNTVSCAIGLEVLDVVLEEICRPTPQVANISSTAC